jgi:Mg/Co/Ni transporter MgtE
MPHSMTVANLVRTQIVRLPARFTVEQARRVVTLRGLDYVFIEDDGQVCGFVDRCSLWRTAPDERLSRWICPGELSIAAEASLGQARALMLENHLECLPVIKRGILIGAIALADIVFNLEAVAVPVARTLAAF